MASSEYHFVSAYFAPVAISEVPQIELDLPI